MVLLDLIQITSLMTPVSYEVHKLFTYTLKPAWSELLLYSCIYQAKFVWCINYQAFVFNNLAVIILFV